jgi:hypothetical protein
MSKIATALAAFILLVAARAEARNTCESAIPNAYRVVFATGTPSTKKASREHPPAETIQHCHDDAWSQAVIDCLAGAKTAHEVYHRCYMLPLNGKPMEIGRRFNGLEHEQNAKADPPMFTVDGDWMWIADGCSAIYQEARPARALFVMCEGQTIGPLVTAEDIQETFAALSADEANRHNIVMSLIKKSATGRFGGTWRVCDANGNCHIE